VATGEQHAFVVGIIQVGNVPTVMGSTAN
jgi:hypothetical protein